MDKIWQIASVLFCLIAIRHYKDGIAVANQFCIMALLSQILAKMEEE